MAITDQYLPKLILVFQKISHFLILSIELLKFIFSNFNNFRNKLALKKVMLQKMQMNIILNIHYLIPYNFSK